MSYLILLSFVLIAIILIFNCIEMIFNILKNSYNIIPFIIGMIVGYYIIVNIIF